MKNINTMIFSKDKFSNLKIHIFFLRHIIFLKNAEDPSSLKSTVIVISKLSVLLFIFTDRSEGEKKKQTS